MSEYSVGDKIRLQFEGEVTYVSPFRTEVLTTEGDVRSFKSGAVRQHVTVLERRKPKVGDTVTRAEARSLPPGSVINNNGRLVFVGVDKMLIGRRNDLLDPALDHLPVTYTVAYLPD